MPLCHGLTKPLGTIRMSADDLDTVKRHTKVAAKIEQGIFNSHDVLQRPAAGYEYAVSTVHQKFLYGDDCGLKS